MTQETEPVKGFRDFSGEEARKRAEIRKIIVETFEQYGFEPAETPIIEREEFVRGENVNDEAVSDVFRLQDKGKRNLALRYEFTFQLKRLMRNKKLPYKRYQVGEVFRDEPISANRFRQFTQCEVDIVGSTIKDEAEILVTAKDILEKLGIKATIYFNNRKLLNEILKEQKIKDTIEVIREIDKLDKLSEKEVQANLKKFGAEKILSIFKKPESYFKKYKSYQEIMELKKYCKMYNIEIKFLPSLARGLSYYDGTIFEIKSDIKESIFGGGSYTFNNVKSVGYGVSIERLAAVSKISPNKEKYLIISLGKDEESIKLANKIRSKNKITSVYYGKPSKALDYANSYGFGKAVFVGEREVKAKKFKVRDMKTGKESLLKI
ncbi:MAG: ATP phosphoribosyltransferase regulatory subunit [Nanoarchaeota archaeon]